MVKEVAFAELGNVKALVGEVLEESEIFSLHGLLINSRKEEETKDGGQEGQRRGKVKWHLVTHVTLEVLLERWEGVSTTEGTNLPEGCGQTVVDTSDWGSRGLGGKNTDVVTWTKLAKGHEDTVNHHKSTDGVDKVWVETSHDVTNGSLQHKTNDKSKSWPNKVRGKGTNKGPWQVEQVEHNVPAKGLVQVVILDDVVENWRGVDTKGIGRKVVDPPDDSNNKKSWPVELNNQEPWWCHLLEVHLGELSTLLEEHSHDEEGNWWNSTNTERNSPDWLEVVGTADPQKDHWDKGRNDETKVDHEVGEQSKVTVSLPGWKKRRSLGTCSRSRWVLGTNEVSEEKSVCSNGSKKTTGVTTNVGLSTNTPGPGGKNGKQDQTTGGDEHTLLSGNVIGNETKGQLANNGTGKSNSRHVLQGIGVGVLGTINEGKACGGSPNGVVNVTIGEQTRTSSEDGPVGPLTAGSNVFLINNDFVTVMVRHSHALELLLTHSVLTPGHLLFDDGWQLAQ